MAETGPIVHSISERGITATHAPQLPPPAVVATTLNKGQYNTIKPTLVPLACWRGADMLFEFESSFVRPEIATELNALKKLIDKHTSFDDQGKPEHRPALSVFGHADPTGRDDLNKALSGRRAQAIYAMLTRKTGLWEELFNHAHDHWDREALGTMLDTVSSGSSERGPASQGAQPESGPAGTGQPAPHSDSAADSEREKRLNKAQHDPAERKKLFQSYMDAVCVADVFRLEPADLERLQSQGVALAGRLNGMLGREFDDEDSFLDAVRSVAQAGELAQDEEVLLREAKKKKPFVVKPEDFLAGGKDHGGKGDYQGCGEFNPKFLQSQKAIDEFEKVPASSPEKPILKAVRDAANEPNRRVLIFLFRPGIRIDPNIWPCPRAKEGTEGCRNRFFSNGDERRNTRLPDEERKYDETNKDDPTFACRFYDRLSNKSPCESGQTAFFEVALPVIPADPGEPASSEYPPAGSALRLRSNNGYSQLLPISAGVRTGDGFCSFRFRALDSQRQDLFTATLIRGKDFDTLFEDRRLFSYVEFARGEGPYVPAFQYEPAPPPDPLDDMPIFVVEVPKTSGALLAAIGGDDRPVPSNL